MTVKGLLGRLVIIGCTALTPQFVVADDDDDNGGSSLKFNVPMSTAQSAVPPTPVFIERARISAVFNKDLSEVRVKLRVRGGANVVAAHFHCELPGEVGPIVFGLFAPGPLVFDGEKAVGTLTNAAFTGADCKPIIGRSVKNIAALALAMREGLIYANVHTIDNLAGEVRAQMINGHNH